MKTKFLLSAILFGATFSNIMFADTDPVIMKINGKEICKSEFEYIYNKNSQQQTIEQKSLDEYVDLFINYKLKVDAAEKQGLDTVPAFVKELEGYRQQLAKPYLVDNNIEDILCQEAYARLKENVEVSHILLRVDPGASPEKVKEIYDKMLGYKQQVIDGKNFNELAGEVSEDPSAKRNSGALGYITGFMTVYPFENAAYNTPVGQISDPVRTSFGYHLVYVTNRRADQGEILAEHIMKVVPADADASVEAEAKKQINDIYKKIKAGENFEELAMANSDDKVSARDGGKLPWFGSGRMVADFEKEAFALKNKGEYSEPFRTPFGWHIVKMLDKRSVASFEDKKEEIVKRIKRDERAHKGQDVLINNLKNSYNVTCDNSASLQLKAVYEQCGNFDSVYFTQTAQMNIPLLKISDKTYTSEDFNDFVKTNLSVKSAPNHDSFISKIEEYTKHEILKYEESQLENKYPEYRNLMREYRDGILLFEVSNNEVWNKASSDEKALEKFFNKNKKNYTWEKPHFKGMLIECVDAETFEKAKELVKGLSNDSILKVLPRELNVDSQRVVRIKKGLFAPGDNKVVDALELNKEVIYQDKKYPEAFLIGETLEKPQSYEDVKGMVTSDYQNYLDKEWIKKLRKKSKIEINKDVLKTVNPL